MTVEQNCANPGRGQLQGEPQRRSAMSSCWWVALWSPLPISCVFHPLHCLCKNTDRPLALSDLITASKYSTESCWLLTPPGNTDLLHLQWEYVSFFKKKAGRGGRWAQTYLNYKEITTKQTTSFLSFLEHLKAICFHFYILRGNHGRFDG